MKRLRALLVVGFVLAAVGVASAATGSSTSSFRGHTGQKAHGQYVALKFTVVRPSSGASYVTGLEYKTIDACTNHKTVTVSHIQDGKLAISSSGRFSDRHKYGTGGGNVSKISGRISGNKASGTVADANVVPPPACHASVKWTASLQ
jgi:hypothetical protein